MIWAFECNAVSERACDAAVPRYRTPITVAIVGIARLVVGGVLLAAAVPKLNHPIAFLQTVYGYELGSVMLTKLAAITVGPVELVLAVLLLGGALVAPALWASAGLLALFALAQGWALYHGVLADCGCFGTSLSAGGAIGAASLLRAVGATALCVTAALLASIKEERP